MPKQVFLEIQGKSETVKIDADAIEETGTAGSSDHMLIIKKKDKEIGKFKASLLVGWWTQFE